MNQFETVYKGLKFTNNNTDCETFYQKYKK